MGNFNDAPWFGDEAEGVTSYFGWITGWTLDATYTYDDDVVVTNLDLVFSGSAILDQYNTGEYNHWNHSPMAPVEITFEMGFSGVPDESEYGNVGGAPSYFVVNAVPEPAAFIVWSLLGLAAVAYGAWRRKR